MARKVSELTQIVLDLVEEGRHLKLQANKSPAIPFMEERMSHGQALRRLESMSVEERRALRGTIGVDRIMEIIRHGNTQAR